MSIHLAGLAGWKTDLPRSRGWGGGARRDRTDDLMLAKHALYQLSYGPEVSVVWFDRCFRKMVGPGRLELPTLRLSGVRSNHLSYGPSAAPLKGAGALGRRPWARDRATRLNGVQRGGKRNGDGDVKASIL
jgi:hypothetical protein